MTPSSIVSPRLLALASLGLLLVAAAGHAARAADAGQGALVFRRCAACHGIDEPINRVGPHLMGVVGRTAGTVPGFSYSMALAGAGIVWTEADLDRWLADPQGFIPGNRMAFAGLADADDRADLIAFLGSVPGPDDPPAPPPELVEIVASAAVAPLLERIAVRFGAAAGRVEPLVRGTTEADALAAFCAGAGGDAPDLLGIARRLRQAELDDCAAAGVEAVSEIRLGHEALVLATGRAAPQRDIELGELWLAFSDLMPGADGLVPSTLQRWPEIDPEQPEGELPSLLGMPGPRQLVALSELGLSRGCLAFPAVEASLLRDTACTSVRRVQRGQSVELAESGIPAALATGAIDLALMTFAGFDAGRTALRPFRINGVQPSLAGIRDGSYQLAQPLHVYVKLARSGRQPGLAAYLATLTGEAAIGPSGDLAALGLVPLPRSERLAARQAARSLPALALGGPNLLPIAPIAQPNQVWSWASAAEMALRSAGLPPLPGGETYRCNVVAMRFGSCEPDCAACLDPVGSASSLARALDAYQDAAVTQNLIGAPGLEPAIAARLKPAALRDMIGNQRSPVLAQIVPRGSSAIYPPGMSSHFALIVGITGRGKQTLLTVNDPYPYLEALNPYLATGERTGEPGQYAISYGDFRQRLGYRQSVVLR